MILKKGIFIFIFIFSFVLNESIHSQKVLKVQVFIIIEEYLIFCFIKEQLIIYYSVLSIQNLEFTKTY